MEDKYKEAYWFRQFVIPFRMLHGIKRYVEHGCQPGNFLTSVICNNLKQAVMSADNEVIKNIPAYVEFFYNHTPMICWGSEENMRNWIQQKRKERGE